MLGADRELLIESGATAPDLSDPLSDDDLQNVRSLRGNGPGGQS